MRNEKKYLLLILFITSIIIGVILTPYFFPNDISLSDSSQQNFTQCSDEKGESYESCVLNSKQCDSDKCRYEQAVLSLDMEQCSSINSSEYRSKCISHINHEEKFMGAVEQDDISLCEEFENEIKISECKDNYYFVMAQNTNDKSLCDKINQEEIKNECI